MPSATLSATLTQNTHYTIKISIADNVDVGEYRCPPTQEEEPIPSETNHPVVVSFP